MTEQDTIKLLRECDAGISMGLSAIDGVIGYVENADFVRVLTESREEHKKLGREVQELLGRPEAHPVVDKLISP